MTDEHRLQTLAELKAERDQLQANCAAVLGMNSRAREALAAARVEIQLYREMVELAALDCQTDGERERLEQLTESVGWSPW